MAGCIQIRHQFPAARLFQIAGLLIALPSISFAQEVGELTAFQAAAIMEKAMVSAIEKAEKSVVAIARVRRNARPLRVEKDDPLDFRLREPPIDPTDPRFVPNEYGTGVIIDKSGLILTNYHVIGKPAENDYYVWINRVPYKVDNVMEPHKVLDVKAADPWTDLAILKINAENLTPITYGDGSKLKKGNIVIALGNPYAIARDGQASATWGIISNLNRKATKNPTIIEAARGGETLHHFGTLIQTDAKLELGTSGGALINLKGQMIGLTTSLAAMEGYEKSAGFAIPVDEVFKKTVDKLKTGAKAEFGFLGVQPADLAIAARQRGELGVRLMHVVQGTPAGQAGLRVHDKVTHVNGTQIHDHIELMRELSKNFAEDIVKLTVDRPNRAPVLVPVKLSKKYIESTRPSYSQQMEVTWRGLKVDFATAIPYFLSKSHNMDPEGCVAVVSVDRDSAAWKAGLRPWTFVNHVNGRRVSTPTEFYAAVADKTGRVQIQLTGAEGVDSPFRTVMP